MADQGTFIVLEGADGSGKGTQFRLLKERLRAVGYEVEVFDFPRYDQPSSHFVRRYLNGEYGPAASISPYTASLFYALDRYEAADEIKKALAAGKIVLCNRYVGSNMAHMGAKIIDPIEQRSFFVWEDSLEFQLLGLPRPNINIFLNVPAEVSYELIAKKAARAYTAKSRDEHEADMDHLKKTVDTYTLLCNLFPADFVAIDCMIGNKLLDIPEINNRIWQLVQKYLPASPQGPGHKVTLKLSEEEAPVESKPEASVESTEPSSKSSYDFGLLSLDLLLKIEAFHPELVSYNLDWQRPSQRFYVPPGLGKKELAGYTQLMKNVAKEYLEGRKAKDRREREAWQKVIPAAALLNAKFRLNLQQARNVSAYLLGIGSPEAAALAAKMNKVAGGNNRAASPEGNPEQLGSIISKIAKDNLNGNLSAETDSVRLFEAIPRNEFKLLADIVYPFSDLSRTEIEINVEGWNYQQKVDTLQAAVLDNAKALADIKYRFDILLDRLNLRKILESRLAYEVSVQPPSPRFGYEVPDNLTPDLEDRFIGCFDESLEVYSLLQKEHPRFAPLATLAGHKVRAHLLINYGSLRSRTVAAKVLPELLSEIFEKVSEVHPVIGATLTDKKRLAEPKPKKSSGHRRRKSKKS